MIEPIFFSVTDAVFSLLRLLFFCSC